MRVLAGSELKDLEPLLSDTKREMGLARELLDTKMKDVIRNFNYEDTDKLLTHGRFLKGKFEMNDLFVQ